MTENPGTKQKTGKKSGPHGVVVLGATGSVGSTALAIIRNEPQQFRVAGLAVQRPRAAVVDLIREFNPQMVSVSSAPAAIRLRQLCIKAGVSKLPEVVSGDAGLCRVAALPGAASVVNALGGAVGLRPSLSALEAGKTLLTANKESIVAAGELITRTARRHRATILPLDSEHSAIFQCLRGENRADVRQVILTASGGPFLHRRSLRGVTPEMALHHPKWNMGPKISVDSATLMNKGLEVIEAARLFDLRPEQVRVVIHPQAVVHSMVEYCDGSIIAQLGVPDMQTPISYALHYPRRAQTGREKWLGLSTCGSLSFEDPDMSRFPCLQLALAALEHGGHMPAALSAADEVAVKAFLERKIEFADIPRVVESAMDRVRSHGVQAQALTLESILATDAAARRAATRAVRGLAN